MTNDDRGETGQKNIIIDTLFTKPTPEEPENDPKEEDEIAELEHEGDKPS